MGEVLLSVRDHSQPCEHEFATDEHLGRGISAAGLWWCEVETCPGGREMVLEGPFKCCGDDQPKYMEVT